AELSGLLGTHWTQPGSGGFGGRHREHEVSLVSTRDECLAGSYLLNHSRSSRSPIAFSLPIAPLLPKCQSCTCGTRLFSSLHFRHWFYDGARIRDLVSHLDGCGSSSRIDGTGLRRR